MSKTYYGEEGKGLRYPAINDMIAKAENKYELVLATAKRARELVDGKEPLVKIDVDNPVSIATNEIAQGKVKIISHGADNDADKINDDDLFKAAETTDAPTTADMAEDE